jgi:hypothetical protein
MRIGGYMKWYYEVRRWFKKQQNRIWYKEVRKNQWERRKWLDRKKKWLNKLFSFVWRNRLNMLGEKYPYHVVKVKGWRTALIDNELKYRKTITFMIRIFGKYF